MSAYDVAFWGIMGGVGFGVITYVVDKDVVSILSKSKIALVTVGVLAGVGAGVVVGSRFRIVGQAVDELRRAF